VSLEDAHAFAAAAARKDFSAFLAYVGVDDRGRALQTREIDRFVWRFAEECFADSAPCGLMLPMGGGKTTLACYRVAFEIGRDPNVLVSLVSYSAERAAELVALVRGILDLETYRRVFPGVRVRSGKDSAARFTVERGGLTNNPTCAGFGVLAGTGTRTGMLVMDDIVTLKNALLEPSSRGHVLEAVRTTWMSRSQLRAGAARRVVWLQTAYHAADAAAVLREDAEGGWRWLVVRAEEPYECLRWERWQRGARVASGVLASPFPAEVLRERAAQMGPTAAARGLANRPVSGDVCVFKEQYFQGPQPLAPDRYLRRSFFADPAGDSTKARTSDTDWCSVVAVGLHPDDKCWEVYLAARIRGSPSRQAEFIARNAVEARAQVVWQEAVKDEALVGVTQEKLKELGAYIPVCPEKPTTHKELRIVQTLEPALAAGQLRICGRAFPELREEALTFPAAAHDDLVDALAGAFGKAQVSGVMRHSVALAKPPDREAIRDEEKRRRSRFRHRVWHRRGRVFYD
jgi:predicted phage terminase large subunit-like protein